MNVISVVRLNPLTAALALVALLGVYGLTHETAMGLDPSGGCPSETVLCAAPSFGRARAADPPPVRADSVCPGSGYLCVGLEQSGRTRIERWKDFTGTLVVHVPRPALSLHCR